METIKIRASAASKITTEPKLKVDKEAGLLGQTAKTYLNELWLQNKYGYREELTVPVILKGKLCEDDSMGLVHKVLGGEFRHKYRNILEAKGLKYLEDDFFTGTPDIVLNEEDFVEDVKTSWDIKTYFNAELEDNYFWQAQVYMHLTKKTNYRLIYCLVPTPQEFILSMKNKTFYALHCDKEQVESKDYEDAVKQIEWNHNGMILEMPEADRLKKFEFKYEPEKIELLKLQVVKARNYYNSIKLK
ncbi:MAG TPA: hypothetical protein VIK86_06420 [Candidatus Paceibacterota bacterium]